MNDVKISLVSGNLLTTSCSMAFLKHIEGMTSTPEREADAAMDGKISAILSAREQEEFAEIATGDAFPFQSLYIVNFHRDDLPFTYSSVEIYAKTILLLARRDRYATSVSTPIHGPGAGLDASEALECMLSAFARELQMNADFGELREIIFVEKDKDVFRRLQERVTYLVDKGETIVRKGNYIFLKGERSVEAAESGKDRIERLAHNHLFVAMPYAKEFNNVYYFGIKGPVEQRKRKSERVDQEKFTGDIVKRVKERIKSSELVIADITGNNPNVFFEIGYAAGIGKEIVLISQKQEIPFDLRTERQITYDPQELILLVNQLGELLDAILTRD